MNIQKRVLLSIALATHLIATAAVEPQGTITPGTAATWADTTGNYIQSTGVTITDAAVLSGIATLQTTTIDANTQGTFVGDSLSKADSAVIAAATMVETATSTMVADTLVMRDEKGDFSARIITASIDLEDGSSEAATKAYLTYKNAALLVKESVVAMALGNTATAGDPGTIDGVSSLNGKRVLLNDQSDQRQNGIWVVNTGGQWSRPADFNSGDLARGAYVLVTDGVERKGSAWQCFSEASLIGIDDITFTPQVQPGQVEGENFGGIEAGNYGSFYKDKTGTVLNFRPLKAGTNISLTSDSNNVAISLTSTILLPTGSAAEPSLFFAGNQQTGLYKDAATDSLAFDIAGSPAVLVNTFTTQLNTNLIMPTAKNVYYDLMAEQVYTTSSMTSNLSTRGRIEVTMTQADFMEFVNMVTTDGTQVTVPTGVNSSYPIQKTLLVRYADNLPMTGNNRGFGVSKGSGYIWGGYRTGLNNRAVVVILTWLPNAGTKNPFVQVLPLFPAN